MVQDIINLIYFPSCENLVVQLAIRLKTENLKLKEIFLQEEEYISAVNYINEDDAMNVVFLCGKDLAKIDLNLIDSLPEGKVFSLDKSLFVLFYIGSDELDSRFYNHFIVKKVHNNIEWIRRELMQLYNRRQQVGSRYNVFVGRKNEIEQFQNLLYSERSYWTKAVFISGRAGVGREAFARACISMTKEKVNYEPFFLSIGENGNVEMLLVQLNSILQFYNEYAIKEVLKQTPQKKTDLAVELLNVFFYHNDFIIIYDEYSCLRHDRKLSDWFRAIVTHPELNEHMQLYVISKVSVNYNRALNEEGVAFFTLYSLTLSERKKLLYKLLSNYEQRLVLKEEDVQFIAENLQYSPSQLVKVVDDIKEIGFNNVKRNIEKYQAIGDNRARPLIEKYYAEDNGETVNVLVFLSKLEFVSENILKKVFEESFDEVNEAIDLFTTDGIAERFGKLNDFVRLDGYFRDYCLRNKIDYIDSSLKNHIRERLSSLIADEPTITSDYSAFMYAIKQKIEEDRIPDDLYLISSVVVNSVIESYHKRKWEQVIALSEQVFERDLNYFPDVFHVIRFWYCLALARLQRDNRFFENVGDFNGDDFHFLTGFFYRNKKKYSKAEEEYIKTLEINPNHQRAKREIVVCLMAQRKFSTALPIAEENYMRDSENAYHMHAFYRCLVRKRNLTFHDRNRIIDLLNDCKKNKFFSSAHLEGMQFEYERFVEVPRKPIDILLIKAFEIEKKYSQSQYIKEIVSELRYESGIIPQIISMDYDDKLGS